MSTKMANLWTKLFLTTTYPQKQAFLWIKPRGNSPRLHSAMPLGLKSAFLRQRRLSEGRWGSNWPNLSPRRPCEAGGEGQSGLKSAFLRPRQHLQRLSGSKEPFLSPRRPAEGVTEGRPEGPQPMSSAGPMRKTSEKAAPGRQGGTNSTARSAIRARRST